MKYTTYILLITIFSYLLIGYINEFVAENQVYHNINNPPLFDRGHNLLPLLPKHLPDIGIALFLLYFIIRWGIRFPPVLINYLWIVTFLFIGRVFVFSITQLPPALPNCSTVQSNSKLDFVLFRKGWNNCIDYMYSGHTIHCVLIALFTLYLSPYSIEIIIVFLALFIELLLIIGSRIHYTADIFVATITTILIFFSWTGIENVWNNIYSGGTYGAKLFKYFVR